MIYLASPYWHTDKIVRAKRVNISKKVAVALMKKGSVVFAPLAYGDAFGNSKGNALTEDQWRKLDLGILSACSMLLVLKIPGWQDSRGVEAEVAFAKEQNMVVVYMEEDEIDEILDAA